MRVISLCRSSLSLLMIGLFLGLLAACGDTTATATPVPMGALTTIAPSATATAAPAATAAPIAAVPVTPASVAVGRTTPLSNPIKVVATTTQLGDFVKNIGGNRVRVYQILKPDDDPHDYEPTADDSKALAGAQIVFKNGVGLDDWLDKVIINSGTKAEIVDVSHGITLRPGKDATEKAGDPHIWHSTDNAKIMTASIARGLNTVDAAGQSYYGSQLTAYTTQLDALKAHITTLFERVPQTNRKLVTNHDAFGYFADEFGIDIVGSIIPNFSDAAQPSAQEINDLITNMKKNNVKVIFTETTINPAQSQQIANAAGITLYANLYGDALGPAGSDGATYLTMELANATHMIAGFQS